MQKEAFQSKVHPRHWYQRPITWAFSLLLGLIVLITTMSVLSLEKIEQQFLQEALVNIEKLRLIDEMVHLSRKRSVLLRDLIISTDLFDQDEIIQNHTIIATKYLLVRNEFSSLPLSDIEKLLLESIIKLNTDSYLLQLEIIEFATTGYTDEALSLISTVLADNRTQIFSDMEKIRQMLLKSSITTKKAAEMLIKNNRATMNWLFLFSVVIGILIAWLAYRQDTRHNRRLHWQSSHDLLTGLGNRYEAETQLNALIIDAQNRETDHALLYIDIDHFNIVNNTSGHAAGDELLKQIAARLREAIGDQNTIERVGSDQFVVLLKDCDVKKAKACARQLLSLIADTRFVWSDKSYDVSASISIVPVTEGRGSAESIWSDAYLACDIAKERGGGSIEVSLESSQEADERREGMDWTTRLRNAMEEDRLVLFSQGIKSIGNGIKHSEILIRYVDENGEFIPAACFIPAAERYNIITEIDRYVVRKTLEFMGKDTTGHSYSINLSGMSLGSNDLLNLIVSEIDENGVDPELVCFEITETAAIRNYTTAVQFMNILNELGCRFFLDDFGTGLSSFGYLRTLPLDMIKIDAHFIRNIDVDVANRAIIEAIHTIARGFGMSTTAEGVEDEKQLATLSELGIDYAQGYYIERPAPLIAVQ